MDNTKSSGIYTNRNIVLLTKHKKEAVIKPILEKATGCNLIIETGFDTDQLGTFTREINRPKSQIDTARLKIEKGMELSKVDIGIASEGSFGMHPYLPIPWNTELVLLYDKKENIELYGICENGDTNFNHLITDQYEELEKFAKTIGFPEHYLIIRPEESNTDGIIKGINNWSELKEAFDWSIDNSSTGKAWIETDMRAFANPTRMKNIEKATMNLVEKLQSLCPSCEAPGFIVNEIIPGLPCELCGLATKMVLKKVSKCQKCNHTKEELYPEGKYASARYCEYCNP